MQFDDLYQEIIMDHYRHPRHRSSLDHISDEQIHENPSCGDAIKLEVRVDQEGLITAVRFDGNGCAISMASASMMSELLLDKKKEEAQVLVNSFLDVMRGNKNPQTLEAWGDLASLAGVIQYPVRVKCATLAWHAAQEALGRENSRG